MLRDLLYALAVAGMLGLAWLERVEVLAPAGTVLGWVVPSVLGMLAFASLRIVHRMPPPGAWEDKAPVRLPRPATRIATQNTRPPREALPTQDPQFLRRLDAALRVVSAYGQCVEDTHRCLGSPLSKLPREKGVIQQAIVFLYSSMEHEPVRRLIRTAYPHQAERILSEHFYNALRIGYMRLTSFLSEEEYGIINKYQNQSDLLGIREILYDHGYDVVDDLAKMVRDTDVLHIISKMRTESLHALRELEKYHKHMRTGIEKLHGP